MAKRLYTYDDIMNLPDFIRVELIDGVIQTDDWTNLEIDEEVFQNPPSQVIMSVSRLTFRPRSWTTI